MSHQRGASLFVGRATGIFGFNDFAISANEAELGALYGRASRAGEGHLSIAAGVAAVNGAECVSGSCENKFTVGLPVVVAGALRPGSSFGIGVQLFVNINPVAAFGGIAGVIELGALR